MSLPYTAAWDEDDDDTVEGDFGPYLGNLRGKPEKPTRTKSSAVRYARSLPPKANTKKPPTEKQILFARAIAMTLDIDLPEELTRQSLFLFIRDNRPKYDVAVHNNRVRSIAEHSDDPDPIDPDEDALMMEAYGLDPYTGGFADNY